MSKRKRALANLAARGKPGTRPGTLVHNPEADATNIRMIRYSIDTIDESQPQGFDDIVAARMVNRNLWIDISGLADIALIEQIGKAFGLHRLALEDVVNVHQRPKTEAFDDHVFIVTRMKQHDHRESVQVAMFVGNDFLLTFHEGNTDCFEPVREGLRKKLGRIRSAGPDYLAYALIDIVVDEFYPILELHGEELEALEEAVVNKPDPSHVTRLHVLKRDLLDIRRIIWPTRELISNLADDESALIQPQTRLYFRDIYDHTIQLMDVVETYREIASGLLDIYLSSVSAHLNEVMKVLTIIATIFIPLSFITGLFGMNFDRSASPWNMPELGWHFGYPLALMLMLAVAAGLMMYFRRKGWLGKSGQ
jgi:magnesium transporter